MKGIQHELLADETDYIYFKYSGKKNLDAVYVEQDKVEKRDGIMKDEGNKGLSSFHKASEFWFVLKGGYIVWINGEEINLSEGDILFIDSYNICAIPKSAVSVIISA